MTIQDDCFVDSYDVLLLHKQWKASHRNSVQA